MASLIWRTSSTELCEAASISRTSMCRLSMMAWPCRPIAGMLMVGSGDRTVRQFVIERARQNARGRGLADAAHAGEDPGLRNAPDLERVRDGAHHGVLADQVVEAGRAVFARQHAIAGAAGASPRSRPVGFAVSLIVPSDRRPRRRAVRFAEIRWEADERPDPCSLGLLPSGPDPVGEWLVHRQPPGTYIGRTGGESKQAARSAHARA